MSKKDEEELKRKLANTTDAAERKKLLDEAAKQGAEKAVAEAQINEEQEQQQQQLQMEQQKASRPAPAWLSPEIKAVFHLIGLKRAFNDKNFADQLKEKGINPKSLTKNVVGYSMQYGKNRLNFNTKNATIETNDLSPNGLSHVAKFASAAGANQLDASSFIKQQQKTHPNHLDQVLQTAYKTAKDEGLALVGLGEKETLIREMDSKNPFKTPELKKD